MRFSRRFSVVRRRRLRDGLVLVLLAGALVGSAVAWASWSSVVLGDAPEGWWRLGEASGTVAADSTGHGHTGAYVNSPTLGAAGSLVGDANTAMALAPFSNPRPGVDVPFSAALNPAGSFSVEAFAKFSQMPGFCEGGVTAPLVVSRPDASSGFSLMADCANGLVEFRFDRSTAGGQSWVYADGGAVTLPMSLGAWYHVVGVWDGASMKIYVNGVDASGTAGGATGATAVNTTAPLRIGYCPSCGEAGAGGNFHGTVDEASVYSVALTTTQVAAHYGQSQNPSPSQPPLPFEQTFGSELAENPGSESDVSAAGGEVNASTGSYSYSVTDVTTPGVDRPFVWTRSYNAADTSVGAFGVGWHHPFEARLQIAPNGDVTVFGGDGQRLLFVKQTNGSFTPTAGGRATLTKLASTYELKPHGAVETQVFDLTGLLTAIKTRNDRQFTLNYFAGVLDVLNDTVGRDIDVLHDPVTGFVTEVWVADGRHTFYGYDGLNRLSTVTDMRGKVWTYAYDGSSSRLASIQDPNGHFVVRNTYDPVSGRVASRLDARGGQTTYGWNAGSQTATITDPAGKVWTEHFENNVLLSRTDPVGNTVSYGYDQDMNRVSETDARGKTTTFTYDAHGNMLTRTAPAPLSYLETWTYDANDQVATYTDGRGKLTTYTYDVKGNLQSKAEPGGRTTSFVINPTSGLPDSMTDPRGKVWTYGYDAEWNRTSVTSPAPLSNTTTYAFDITGRMTSTVSPRGNVSGCACAAQYTTSFAYDGMNHKLTETDPLAHATTYTYDNVGNLRTVTNHLNKTWTYDYDEADNKIRETTPLTPTAQVTEWSYNERGLMSQVKSPENELTTYGYDDAGRKTSMVEPRGNVAGCACAAAYTWTYELDANGNVKKVTSPDPDGGGVKTASVTETTFDELNRVKTVIDARGKTTTYQYDEASNLLSSTDPESHTWSTTYDDAGRKATATDARGKVTTYAYDLNDNLTQVTTQLGFITKYGYDEQNRRTSMITPRGNVAACACAATYTWAYGYDRDSNQTSETPPGIAGTTWTYDAANRRTSEKDGNLHETQFVYDDINRLITVIDPIGVSTTGNANDGKTAYTYDEVGNLKTRTDANGRVTTYAYDLDNRRKQMDMPAATTGVRTWKYTYDPSGHLTKMEDANGTATTGVTTDGLTQYTFDFAGRLTGMTYSNAPAVSYDLDPAGNRLSMTDGAGTETYVWTDANRLQSVTRGANAFSYLYDANGNVTQRTYPDSTVVAYAYDDDNRMSTVTQGTDVVTYGYDEAANLKTTTLPAGNGYVESRTYDSVDRLTEVKNAKAGVNLSKFTLTLDPVGNPTRIDKLGTNSETYKYDFNDRITEACYKPSGAACTLATDPFVRWTYDPVGNRLTEQRPTGTVTSTINNADQLTQEASSNQYAAQATTDGAQPYWRMGDSSTTSFTSSVGTFNGTWTNAPTTGVAGALGGDTNTAVTLNGTNEYGSVANATALNKTNNFSVELWVKRTKNAALQAIAGKPLSTTTRTQNYAFWFDTANKIRFDVGKNTAPTASVSVTSPSAVDTGWHHVVGTFASGVTRLYIDGTLVASTTATFTAATTNTSQFQIGRSGTTNYYGGSLDEIAIYGTVLTCGTTTVGQPCATGQIADHYNKRNALSTAYTYDLNGNQTGKGTRTYAWNVANQLTSTTDGGTTTTYTYDGDSKRLNGVTGATTVNYQWDRNYSLPQLALERDGANTLLRRYTTGLDTLTMTTPTTTNWLLHDNLGSVVNTTNAAGATQWTREYEPYGTKRVDTNTSGTAPATPLQYTGEYLDGNNGGLYNLRARQYDPANGRFLSQDPVAPAATDPWISPFAYVNLRPTVLFDPSGLYGWGDLWNDTKSAASVAKGGVEAVGGEVVSITKSTAQFAWSNRNIIESAKYWRAQVKDLVSIYRSQGGGLMGLVDAVNMKYNPAFHALLASRGCRQAIQAGASAEKVGKACTKSGIKALELAFVAAGGARAVVSTKAPMGAAAEGGATLGQRARGLLLDETGQLGGFSIKGRVKAAQLPTSGRIRYVPPTGYKPSMPLPRGSGNGYVDRFGNEWVRGPSRTAGEAFEWDVQLSRTGREQLGWLSSDGSHVNVSLGGRVTH